MIGMGVAATIRNNPLMPAKARLRLGGDGRLCLRSRRCSSPKPTTRQTG